MTIVFRAARTQRQAKDNHCQCQSAPGFEAGWGSLRVGSNGIWFASRGRGRGTHCAPRRRPQTLLGLSSCLAVAKIGTTMAGLLKLINRKPKAHINVDEEHCNPYAVALKYPEESERLFDCDLKLLLMDG
jgi:hypothetical protein